MQGKEQNAVHYKIFTSLVIIVQINIHTMYSIMIIN